MKRFSEQFNKKANTVKLRAAERRELKDRLVSYMEYHPLPAEMKVKAAPAQTKAALVSEPFKLVNVNFTYIRAVVSSMAVLTIAIVPFMAENSLPGDVLYPVKVEFNEELRSSLSLTAYAKVEWETERLERRVAEARLLASEGKLTEEVEAEVAQAVKTHSDNAQKEIETLRESDSDEADLAEIAFASALTVQSESLASDEVENGSEEVSVLASVVKEETDEANAKQANADPAYEKLLARVEAETTRAQELFISISDVASPDERTDIERRLSDIDTKVQTAIALHDTSLETAEVPETTPVEVIETEEPALPAATSTATDTPSEVSAEEVAVEEVATVEVAADDSEARAALRSALSDTRKLISFMTNIDVREHVTVEELVPVTLTDSEHEILTRALISEISISRETISARIVDEVEREKFDLAIAFLDEQLAEVEQLLADKSYAAAYDVALVAGRTHEDLINRSAAPAESAEPTAPVDEQEVIDDEPATTTPEVEEIEEEPVEEETEDDENSSSTDEVLE